MSKESSTTTEGRAEQATPEATDETSARGTEPQAASTAPAETTPAEPGSNGSGTTSERATAMRATLGARRDAESLLAEASALRRTAANDADAMVAEAETLAEQLLSETKQSAEKTTVEAQERAEGIVARARSEAAQAKQDAAAEAEEVRASAKAEADELRANSEAEREKMRAEVRAEVEKASRAQLEELHAKSDVLLRQVELGVHGLGPALEGAMSVVGDVIGSLERLRSVTPGEAPDFAELKQALAAVEMPEPRAGNDVLAESAATDEAASPGTAEVAVVGEKSLATTSPAGVDRSESLPQGDDAGARPLGWLFRASQS